MKVAFIGQINIKDKELVKSIYDKVEKAVEKLIVEFGADLFIFGTLCNFENICYYAVTKLKDKYPHIRRFCINQFRVYSKRSRKHLDNNFDDWTSPATNREMGNMPSIKVNRKIVDECDLLIAYYDKDYDHRRI